MDKKQEFKNFCAGALPYIVELTDLLRNYPSECDMSLYADTSGYVRLRIGGNEWRLRRRDQNSEFEIILEIREQLT